MREAESTIARPVRHVDVAALALIVRDLLAAGLPHAQGGAWLEERMAAALLDRHERGALAALQEGLRLGDRSLFDTVPAHWL